MKITLKGKTTERKNSEACVVTEYPVGDEMIDFAIVKIAGRYPSIKHAVNKKCKEIVYINEGSGKVVVEGKEYLIGAGDLVLIEAGEKFYWDGEMQLYISCRPAFTKDQHQLVD
ncbi:MAG: cupin domain-containing protein [Proteobacteria bacterium]|nr:cupin domain-containing protein [Pseudomonadota bacterium]